MRKNIYIYICVHICRTHRVGLPLHLRVSIVSLRVALARRCLRIAQVYLFVRRYMAVSALLFIRESHVTIVSESYRA